MTDQPTDFVARAKEIGMEAAIYEIEIEDREAAEQRLVRIEQRLAMIEQRLGI